MAVNGLDARPYVRDPWFLFGSQDSFSLFSPLYGVLIRWLDLADAARTLVLLGALSWLGAAWLAVRRIWPASFPAGVALLSCAVFSLNISPLGSTFVLNEIIATARLLAIPLGIASLVSASRGKTVLALFTAVSATVLHPLYGIWAVLLVIALRISDRLIAGALVIMAVAFALVLELQALPLAAAVTPGWMDFLRASTRDLLVPAGSLLRLNSVLFWVSGLLLGATFGREDFRRTYLLIALLALLGYLLSLIVSNFRPIDLLLKAQPWRAVWLAAFFSVLALVDVGWRMVTSSEQGPYLALSAALILILCKPVAGFVLLAAWSVAKLPALLVKIARIPVPSLALVRIVSVAALLLAVPGYVADVRLEGEFLTLFGWTGEDVFRGVVGGGGCGLGPLLIAGLVFRLRHQIWLPIGLLLTAATWGALNWDTRGAWERRWEESLAVPAALPFEGFSAGETVYWPGELPRVWFELGTAGYVGIYHQSGLVFSQARAELIAARWRRAAVSSVAEGEISSVDDEEQALEVFRRKHPERDFLRPQIGSYVASTITPAGVKFVCADPDLDWVIADFPRIGMAEGLEYIAPSEPRNRRYAFSCRSLRQVGRGEKMKTDEMHHG